MCAASDIGFETHFEFWRGIRLHDAERLEAARVRLFREGRLDRGRIFQKSRSESLFDGGRPASVSARIARNDGRDFTRAYQFFVASSSFHGTSPKSSADERCDAAARSARLSRSP